MTGRLATALVVMLAVTAARSADPPGSPRVDESLALCNRAPKAPPAERAALLARGLKLAEEAVAANEKDAKAHFAVFCNVGKQMELRGISLKSAVDVRRLRREIDRTLELAPDYSDALVGKGALLLDLPRLLGGDPAEGERLLRAALRVDPDYVDARLKLARALDARGAKDEAREEAVRAVAAAERDPDDREQLEEARELLTRLAR